ncbi:MAG TPA: hypothetical protein VNF71_11650 [Acidimicrobiales bacterium]|nr:hypothetical protein [Acidimicrobiales bacterium]
MLFLHEVHRVQGAKEGEFEAAYRDYWMPTMAKSDYARLLWYTNHALGSGVSYNVVTITAVEDGRAWEDLIQRVQKGDLKSWMLEVDNLRHDVVGKVLVPVHWSPLQEVDLGSVPVDGRLHEPSLFMEDTGWPYAPLDVYIQGWYDIYYAPMEKTSPGQQLLDIQACFQPAHGTHQRREAMLWQKILRPAALTKLLSREARPEQRAPGTYMHEALALRDQWESKLLRTSSWSPLF